MAINHLTLFLLENRNTTAMEMFRELASDGPIQPLQARFARFLEDQGFPEHLTYRLARQFTYDAALAKVISRP